MRTRSQILAVLGIILCQIICQAQGIEAYKARIGDPQANYYSIAAEMDSALQTGVYMLL